MASTTTHPTRRFFGQVDAHSLSSSRDNNPSLTPPSLKANSLKARKSMNILMSSRFSLKRDAQKDRRDGRSGLRGEVDTTNRPAAVEETKETSIQPRKVSTDPEVENLTHPPISPPQLQRSRSRAIIRMISTTFRTNVPPSDPSRVPVPASDLTSKANRDAALRARGLLPPLTSNKGLSRLEQEQDQRIPPVNPADETVVTIEGDTTTTITAANLVKQQWEEKNQLNNSDTTRMKSYKFGGLPSPAPSIMEQISSPAELETVVEADGLWPAPSMAQQADEHMALHPEDKLEASATPPRNKRTPPLLVLDFHTVATSDYILSPQSPAIAPNMEPHLVPLPLSPLDPPQGSTATSASKSVEFEDPHISASSFPIPRPLSPPVTPRSLKSTPVISLSPPPSASLDGSTDFSHSDSVAFAQPSFLSESGSLETTPSLDGSSQTMTVSSSESLSSMGKGKSNMLKLHHHTIPIIVESPVEESSRPNDSVLGSYISHEPSDAEGDDGQPSTTAQIRRTQTVPSPPTVAKADHQTPVKRGQTLDPSNATSAKQRLSMLSTVRRSVVGSLNRSKSTFSTGRNKNVPRSSTVPRSLTEQARNLSPTRSLFLNPRPSDVGVVPRSAAAPTLHNRASILVGMDNIEDEETRRVTELAFLG